MTNLTLWVYGLQSPLKTVRVIKSKSIRWADHVARMEEGRRGFKFLTGTPTGKRTLGGFWDGWEDNIRINVKEIDIYTRNRIDYAQDRDYWRALVSTELNLRVT